MLSRGGEACRHPSCQRRPCTHLWAAEAVSLLDLLLLILICTAVDKLSWRLDMPLCGQEVTAEAFSAVWRLYPHCHCNAGILVWLMCRRAWRARLPVRSAYIEDTDRAQTLPAHRDCKACLASRPRCCTALLYRPAGGRTAGKGGEDDTRACALPPAAPHQHVRGGAS